MAHKSVKSYKIKNPFKKNEWIMKKKTNKLIQRAITMILQAERNTLNNNISF